MAVLLVGGEAGCKKRHALFVPPAAPVQSDSAAAPAQTPATDSTVTPPVLTQPTQSPPVVQTLPPVSPPPSPPSRRARRTPAAAPPGPAAAPAPVPAKVEAPPQLGDILSPQQQRELNADIDQTLKRAQANLEAVETKSLSKEQQSIVVQVRSFVEQAQTTRKSDLPSAKRLADRADVLAKDLAGSLR